MVEGVKGVKPQEKHNVVFNTQRKWFCTRDSTYSVWHQWTEATGTKYREKCSTVFKGHKDGIGLVVGSA